MMLPTGREPSRDIEVEDFSDGIPISSGQSYNLTLESATGALSGVLMDEDLTDILPGYPYEIFDGSQKILDGTTDENGFFLHPDIPADYYVLKANDEEHPIVTIQEDDEPLLIGVLNEKGEFPADDEYDMDDDG